MAGKGKMAAARPTSREQILDRSIGSLAERHTPDLKADALQRRLQDVHRTLVGGGDAGAADKRLGKGNGLDHDSHCARLAFPEELESCFSTWVSPCRRSTLAQSPQFPLPAIPRPRQPRSEKRRYGKE